MSSGVMSLCSAEDIAEKRRIALEKLNSKKRTLSNLSNISPKPVGAAITESTTANSNNASTFLRTLQNGQKNLFPSIGSHQARTAAQPYPKHSPFKNNTDTSARRAIDANIAASPPIYSPNVRIVKCWCAMVSVHRFGLYMSEYHGKVVEVCKSISSRSYDADKKLWSFDRKDYELVLERMAGLRPNVVTEGISKKVLAQFAGKDDFDDGMISSYMNSITPVLMETLLPFQKEGVAFGIRKQGHVLIADEMGLGKTYQALALADFYKEDWPLLVATTASTRDSWVSHVRKLLTYVNCNHIFCVTTSSDFFDDAKVVICSYAMLEKCIEKLQAMRFGVLIMDESHTLKNPKAKCTLVADSLAKKAKRVILLSGTPALSRPVELFSQLKMLDRGFLSYMDYTKRYCDGKQGSFGWVANGQSNLEELKVILFKKFMIRRLKADVLPQLLEKNRETVFLDPALIKQSSVMKHYASTLSQNSGPIKEEVLIHYYAETAHVKHAAICSYLKGVIKSKQKFVIFAHHKVVIDAICEFLKEAKVKHVRVDGSTRNELRAERIDCFQTKDNCMVAVLSLRACNAGINLTAAQLILFAELDWNPSTLAQAESRAHRIGQNSEVTCRYLLARGTADDIIWKMLHNKQDVLKKAGLFSEDLRKSEHIVGPNTAGNIEKYLVVTPRKENCDASIKGDGNTANCTSQKLTFQNTMDSGGKESNSDHKLFEELLNDGESFNDLLNDGDDDDFANIVF